MSFEDDARRETRAALDTLVKHASDAARHELDALRAALDARMAALEAALVPGDTLALVERLTEDLSRAAAEQTEELVARARHEAQEAADVRLTEVQNGARSELEWARGENAALNASLDDVRRQLGALEESSRSSVEARGELQAQLAQEQQASAEMASVLADAKETASAAHDEAERSAADLESIRARFQELDKECRDLHGARDEAARASSSAAATRADLEAQLADERSTNIALSGVLAEAEQAVSTARGEAQRRMAEMEAAVQGRIQRLEDECRDLRVGRDEAAVRSSSLAGAAGAELEAQLARERLANADLSGNLAKAQDAASSAHAEAQRSVGDLESVRERVRQLEGENRTLRAARDQADTRASSEAAAREEETSAGTVRLRGLESRLERADGETEAVIDRVKKALRAFTGAASAQAIFDTLVTELAREFVSVALYLHRRNRLEGWRSQGLDSQSGIGNVVIPLTMDSPLARAVNTRTPVAIEAGADGVKVGVFGKPVQGACAWPVLVGGNVVAVAYVEDSDGRLARPGSSSRQIAEILVEQVSRCLVMGRGAGGASASDAAQSPEARPGAGTRNVVGTEPPKAARPSPTKAVETAAQVTAVPRATKKPLEQPKESVSATRAASPTPAPPVEPVAVAAVAPPQEAKAVSPPAADSDPDAGPARQVDRIKIRPGVDVSVDGTTGQLFDLSVLGAQVTSQKSIRPQQMVRLVLPGVSGPLVCKGRVMWARFEKIRAGDPGPYRAGIKFTEADPIAVEAFLKEYAEKDLARPA